MSLNMEYLRPFRDTTVTMERIGTTTTGDIQFDSFPAPLALFLDNLSQANPEQFYIAQQPIDLLPQRLREDLPTPSIISQVGRGDIYGSSIWIGNGPETFTPLHKDPNPNLFLQLAGTKEIRLICPEDGMALFTAVRRRLGQATGFAAMRGEEMMQGEEGRLLRAAVWDDVDDGNDDGMAAVRAWQVRFEVRPYDVVFIPKGWWHSIRGSASPKTVIASANW